MVAYATFNTFSYIVAVSLEETVSRFVTKSMASTHLGAIVVVIVW
jgi:uncharacterized protein YfaT (DUF1175 family)